MKPIVVVACSLGLMAFSTTANAQNALCHHAGLTYSPGALITMGKSLQKCTATRDGISIWAPSTSEDREVESANCVADGEQYGQGAVVDGITAYLKCSNGTWYPL